MGITPGGATPASFMSYGLAKKFSKTGSKFGTGEVEGVIAPETAAHAAGTSALLPMLALGIPGSPTAAVLLGGLLIWGLQPGPLLFVEQKDFVWGLIASMYLGNLVGLIVVLTTVPLFASILRIPFSIIAPVIIVICAIGAYTVHNAMLDIWFMLGFGVIGYVFKKLDYPLAPLVLALVLGDKAEDSFRQAMLVSQGEVSIMWANPLVGSITTLALVMLFWPLISKAAARDAHAQGRRTRRRSGRSTDASHGDAMPVIALTQGMGSLAQDIAEQLAAELKLSTLQHEVAERVAEKMHVSRSLISRLRGGKAGTDRAPARRPRGDGGLHRRGGARGRGQRQRRAPRLGRDPPAAPGAARALHPHHAALRQARAVADGRDSTPTTPTSPRPRSGAATRPTRRACTTSSASLERPGAVRHGAQHRPPVGGHLRAADQGAAGAARVRRDRGVARAAAGHGAAAPMSRRAARPRRDTRASTSPSRAPATRSRCAASCSTTAERAAAEQVAAAVPGVPASTTSCA